MTVWYLEQRYRGFCLGYVGPAGGPWRPAWVSSMEVKWHIGCGEYFTKLALTDAARAGVDRKIADEMKDVDDLTQAGAES